MARSLSDRLRSLHASVGQMQPEVVNPPGQVQPQVAAEPGQAQPSAPGAVQTGGQGPMTSPAAGRLEAVQMKVGQPLNAVGFNELSPGVWHRRLGYDVLTLHGKLRFAHLADSPLTGLQKLAKLPASGPPLAFERLRFYDTETTGLGTGAGTFPFLHAVGQFEDDEFAVHQYFLADYAAEAELLRTMLRGHFQDGTPLVSFNGKSFDWPLLSSRLALHRMTSPAVAHLDLLYPSRRLWRQSLQRVSLGTVESEVLDLKRTDDLPGKEAPLRYFEFVADGDVEGVLPVFEHNAMDVCSLVTLAARLIQIVSGTEQVQVASEWSALGRIYDEWHESLSAAHCFQQAVACPDASWREHWMQSMHAKRQGQLAEAVQTWLCMVEAFPWTVPPCVELAKAYEHHCKELEAALRFAREAKARTVRFTRHDAQVGGGVSVVRESRADEGVLRALDHRVNRIMRKLAKEEIAGENRNANAARRQFIGHHGLQERDQSTT